MMNYEERLNGQDGEEPDDVPSMEDGMNSCCVGDLVVIVNTRGAIAMAKGNYPARYGLYGEIRTRDYAFHFNPTGEIRYIRGLTRSWPHPWEWLKRTWGNDWVYYTVGLNAGMGRVSDWVGESYIPCLSYESNAIREGTPYSDPRTAAGFSSWAQVYGTLCGASLVNLPEDIRNFVSRVIETNNDSALIAQADRLHSIFGSRISVLPPDTRHVDYEVIPVNIADGCLYRCTFCSVKSGMHFRPRTEADILQQIDRLKTFFGINTGNFNAVFIGNHDALAAGISLLHFAALKSFESFGFEKGPKGVPHMFLFGSAGSFLKSGSRVFETLARLPYKTFINLGLESYDGHTLKKLGKPIEPAMVKDSLQKMMDINRSYPNLEISANFLLGTTFSPEHHESLVSLLGAIPKDPSNKGSIYLSPLIETVHRDKVLPMFYDIKNRCGIPVYIYLIQRL